MPLSYYPNSSYLCTACREVQKMHFIAAEACAHHKPKELLSCLRAKRRQAFLCRSQKSFSSPPCFHHCAGVSTRFVTQLATIFRDVRSDFSLFYRCFWLLLIVLLSVIPRLCLT
ncbi:hypothetical protein L596_004050 [Steinernema carpocapsae]|uniref:Uncharacterized protein n=1 Tax=Steinernema carpocapsae TaxID=34508 RepID=A0A4U8UVL1_STECR|nr:hypothetical protein L596_004050 [Steinernema carpocapsae]